MVQKVWLTPILLMVILSSSIYMLWDDQVRIDVQNTKTIFSVYENGDWVVGATEYLYLYDGTKKMRASKRWVTNESIGDYTKLIRHAIWKDDIITQHVYVFDRTVGDIEQVPIESYLICNNCQNKIVHFEYRVDYDGETRTAISPESFEHRMKIEWQDGYDWAKVYRQKVAQDKLIIRYRPTEATETYRVRMFDPVVELTLSLESTNVSQHAELGSLISIIATTNNTGDTVCVDIDHPDYGVNYSCGTGSVSFDLNITYFNTTKAAENITFTGHQNKSYNISVHEYDRPISLLLDMIGFESGGNYPANVRIYINGVLSNYVGFLFESSSMELTVINESTSSANITFADRYSTSKDIGYFKLPKIATVNDAYFNLTGYKYTTPTYYGTNSTVDNNASGFTGSACVYPCTHGDIENAYDGDLGTYAWSKTKSTTKSFTPWLSLNYSLQGFTEKCDVTWKDAQLVTGDRGSTVDRLYCYNDTAWILLHTSDSISNPGENTYTETIPTACLDNGDDTVQLKYIGGIAAWSGTAYTAELRRYDTEITYYDYKYPTDVEVDIGVFDGSREFNNSGTHDTNNQTDNLSTSMNTYLDTCTADSDGFCEVPVLLIATSGVEEISAISINYTSVTENISVSLPLIETELLTLDGTDNLTLTIESESSGIVEISNLRYYYAGGDKTYNIKVHDAGDTTSESHSVVYHYSYWDYEYPQYVDYMEFVPTELYQTGISAHGQTDTRPILNITAKKSSTEDFSMSLKSDGLNKCVKMGISDDATPFNLSVYGHLVAHYSFDRTLVDSMSTNNGSRNNILSGAVTGATWTDDCKYGSCLDFDGTDDYVKVGSNLLSNTTATWSFWYYADSLQSGRGFISNHRSGDKSYSLYNWGNQYRFSWMDAATTNDDYIIGSVKLQTWTHLAVTFDNGNVTFYEDGSLLGSKIGLTNIRLNSQNIYIGRNWFDDTSQRFFEGKMDSVRMWNQSLSQSEIQAEMNSYLPLETTNITAAFEFDEGSGSTTESVPYTVGVVGEAIYLNGVSDVVTLIDDYLDNHNTATIMFWVKRNSWATGRNLFSLGDGNDRLEADIMYTAFTHKAGGLLNSDERVYCGFATDTWTQVIISTDGTLVSYGKNGYTIWSETQNNMWSGDGNIYFGGLNSTDGPYFDGLIDEVMIFDTDLPLASAYGTPTTETSLIYNRQSDGIRDVAVSDTFTKFGYGFGDTTSKNYWMWVDLLYHGGYVDSDDLISHYKLDLDATDSQGTNDGTRYGNITGTLNGGISWSTDCKFGNCISSDRSASDYVSLPFSQNLNMSITDKTTVSTWVKPNFDTVVGIYEPFISTVWDNDVPYFLYVESNQDKIFFETRVGGTECEVRSTTPVSKDTWMYVTGIFNGTDNLIYIDGTLENATVCSFNELVVDSDPTYIGGKPSTGYDGIIDSVRIWNKVLSQDEIREEMWSSLPVETSGLIASMELDEGTGSTTYSVPYTSGQIGEAMWFDGVDDYVTIGDLGITGTTDVTYSAWINLAGNNTSGLIVGGRRGDRNTFVVASNLKLVGRQDDTAISSVDLIQYDTWTHVVYSFEYNNTHSIYKLYINGSLDNTKITTSYDAFTASTMWIGWESRYNYWFNGSIDDVRIYDITLNEDEIENIYLNGASGCEDPDRYLIPDVDFRACCYDCVCDTEVS